MLIEGRCSIYSHRPSICRGYGYFSATLNGDNALLICKQEGPAWIKHLEAAGVEEIPMPNWNPIQRQVKALNQGGQSSACYFGYLRKKVPHTSYFSN